MAGATTMYDASVSGWGSLEFIIFSERNKEQRYLALDPAWLDVSEKGTKYVKPAS